MLGLRRGVAGAPVLMWLAFATTGACQSRRPAGRQCVFNEDCAEGLVCAGNFCRPQCRASDRDCPPGTSCRPTENPDVSVCLPASTCLLHSDCPANEICYRDGMCRVATCHDDRDCPNGAYCDRARSVCAAILASMPDGSGNDGAGGDAATDGFVDGTLIDTPEVDGQPAIDANNDVPFGDGSVDVPSTLDVRDATAGDVIADLFDVMGDVTCMAGYSNCDGDPRNGCETFTVDNAAHCGRCGGACPTPPSNGRGACAASTCTIACDPGFGASGGLCIRRPLRLIAPVSTSSVTLPTPTLRWQGVAGVDGARVEICRTRGCSSTADVVATFDAVGTSGRPPTPLATGTYFWRVRAMASGAVVSPASVTWQFAVWPLPMGATGARPDTALGTTLDLNGDGHTDVAVGSSGTGERVDVFLWDVVARAFAAPIVVIGPGGSSGFGKGVASGGDTNGDGYADLLVGAPADGELWVYFGGPDGIAPGDSSRVRRIGVGMGGVSDRAGAVVAGLGDSNGDGYGDVAVGADQSLIVRVLNGSALGPTSGVEFRPTVPTGSTSSFVMLAGGDYNGDGFADVLASAKDPVNSNHRVELRLGGPTGIGLSADAVLTRPADVNVMGDSLAACDLTGDGYADGAVGAPNIAVGTMNWVLAYHGGAVAFGGATPAYSTRAGNTVNLLGRQMARAGDVNLDGFCDLIVAPATNQNRVFVILGGATGLTTVSRVVSTPSALPGFGWSVAGGGDVDGNGFPDFAVASSSAEVFVFVSDAVGSSPAFRLTPGAVVSGWGLPVAM